jgi:putative phosphotransacetylase
LDTEQLIRDVVRNVMEQLDSAKKTSQGSSAGLSPGILKGSERKIVCGVSVRHIHLCKEHADVLFGKGYELTALRDLYNPGFAAKETLTVVGPKLNAIQNIRVLGPFRGKTQVELAKTDCIILGIDAPVRPSGEVTGSSSAVLIGPKGAVYLSEGVIRANRHMHLSTVDAQYFGIKDNQVVDVRAGGPKGLTFNNVQVRVAPDFKAEFHVDTDDGNAADIINGTLVEIVDASCISPLAATMADKDHTPPQIPDGSFAGEVSDSNLVKNICAMSTGRPCVMGQGASAAQVQAEVKNVAKGPAKKTVITFADLDNYAQTGIKLSGDVILSPLARDEAIKRGIKIT